jgi:DNA-binding MarR family transcriptional regulator
MDATTPTAVTRGRADEAAVVGDEELATRYRVAITRLYRRLRQESLAGLSPAQASALAMIDRLGTPTLGELALAEQVQPPTMTRLIAGMEDAGHVVRVAEHTDRGRRTLLRIRSLKNAFLMRRLTALDPTERGEAETLVSLLEHLLDEG